MISQRSVLLNLSISRLENAMQTELIIYACSSPCPGQPRTQLPTELPAEQTLTLLAETTFMA